MSNKVKMAPELKPNNQETNTEQQAPVKLSFAERHPKLVAGIKAAPGKIWGVTKKLVGGALVIASGVFLGLVGLEVAKPKRYYDVPLQLPPTEPRLSLPPVTETKAPETIVAPVLEEQRVE